jgi:hypothetical protein
VPRFDWYEVTLDQGADEVLAALVRGLELASVEPMRADNGYLHAARVYRIRGEALAQVLWGGNPGTHVRIGGASTDEVVPVLREAFPAHRVTRVDVATDFEAPGFFADVTRPLIEFAVREGLRLDHRGDWERGEARTLYIGSEQSPVRLVVYEKGYEQGQGDTRPDWVRIEARVRPQGGTARARFAALSPVEVMGSAWLPRALDAIDWLRVEAVQVGKGYRRTESERARSWLVLQYGRILAEWRDQAGSWESVGSELGKLIEAREAA